MHVVERGSGTPLVLAFIDYVYPGLGAADEAALQRIASRYALDHEPEDASSPFTQPSLFITGRQDQVVGYRDAWARIEHYPRSTFAALDAAGHNVHLDQATWSVAHRPPKKGDDGTSTTFARGSARGARRAGLGARGARGGYRWGASSVSSSPRTR
jgi:hypothetical protein